MTTLREEIEGIIYRTIGGTQVGIRWNEVKEVSAEIIKTLESRIDKKIELIDQEVLNPEFIALNDCMGCIQEKKKAYLEMKDMLRK